MTRCEKVCYCLRISELRDRIYRMGAAERVVDRVARYVIASGDAKAQAAAKVAIADACGVTPGLVRGWLNGNNGCEPRLHYLDELAAAIGMDACAVVAPLAQESSDQVQGPHPQREVGMPMSDPMFLTLHQVWTELDLSLRKRLVNLATAEHNPRKPRGDLQRARKSGR